MVSALDAWGDEFFVRRARPGAEKSSTPAQSTAATTLPAITRTTTEEMAQLDADLKSTYAAIQRAKDDAAARLVALKKKMDAQEKALHGVAKALPKATAALAQAEITQDSRLALLTHINEKLREVFLNRASLRQEMLARTRINQRALQQVAGALPVRTADINNAAMTAVQASQQASIAEADLMVKCVLMKQAERTAKKVDKKAREAVAEVDSAQTNQEEALFLRDMARYHAQRMEDDLMEATFRVDAAKVTLAQLRKERRRQRSVAKALMATVAEVTGQKAKRSKKEEAGTSLNAAPPC
jgi:hypothetical protein